MSATEHLPPATTAALREAISGSAKALFTPWPTLESAAWHGPVGEFALDARPHIEADPVGVLVSLLAGAGAVIGSGPHLVAGNVRHPANIWPVLVGVTASRKGTAWAAAREPLRFAAPEFFGTSGRGGRVLGGWGSGEALVDALRDGDDEHPGATDKRLLVIEPEYARLLRVASREGATLSMLLRNGWDGQPLESRTRGAGVVVATGHHLVVSGHITPDELKATMTSTDVLNGWANRFLWVSVRRSNRLPDGGNVPAELAERTGRILSAAISTSRSYDRVDRTDAARRRWREVYDELADDEPPGMLGAVVGRSEPQCARLSVLYALLDGSPVIDEHHVEAGYALWRYSRASAARIWGDAVGNPLADRLLAALSSNGGRLTTDECHQVLGRHVRATELADLRQVLVRSGLATEVTEQTAGRPREVLVLCEKSEEGEIRSRSATLTPFPRITRFPRNGDYAPDEPFPPPTDDDLARWDGIAEGEA